MKISNLSLWFIVKLLAAVVGSATCFLNYESIIGTVRQTDPPKMAQTFSPWWRRLPKPLRDDSDPMTATSVHPIDVTAVTPGDSSDRPTVFSDELECMAANDGQSCVCSIPEFFASMDLLLKEAQDDPTNTVVTFACQSYKPVASVFVVSPSRIVTTVTNPDKADETTTAPVLAQSSKITNKAALFPISRNEVDFYRIIHYQLDESKDDHFKVHYGLIGSFVKIRCLANRTGINAFKWEYKKNILKTNSTINGTDTNILLISHLHPKDTKNYTCVTGTTSKRGRSKTNKNINTHYVIAIDKPIYEIRGSAFYKTTGGCTQEIINPIRRQLPGFVQTEICSEGSSRYACNVVVESLKCSKDESTLEVNYVVTSNDKASYLTRIMTSKMSKNALFYHKLLAKITNVFAENLNKTLMIPIVSKYSMIDMHFKSDRNRIKVTNFVSCAPGFGIREVFCSACPPNHYSPKKSTNCLKCSFGFHQLAAGSAKCIKCPHLFASGCLFDLSAKTYHYIAYTSLFVVLILVVFGVCCCREKSRLTKISIDIKQKYKRKKKYELNDNNSLANSNTTNSTTGQRFKNLVKRKFKRKILVPKVPIDSAHGRFRQIPEDN